MFYKFRRRCFVTISRKSSEPKVSNLNDYYRGIGACPTPLSAKVVLQTTVGITRLYFAETVPLTCRAYSMPLFLKFPIIKSQRSSF